MSLDEAVETLVNLGLTTLQAKVYITLAKLGTSTGRATARAARVASQDVYRLLSELQEKGLVEKILAKPNQYRPTPLEEGLSILLERRSMQTVELKKAADEISRSVQTIDKEEANEKGDFVIIPQNLSIKKKLEKAFGTAQSSIYLMNDFREEMTLHDELFALEVQALDNGVKIKDIIGKTHERVHNPKSFQALLKREPDFIARYLYFGGAPANLIIIDNKEIFISTMRKESMSSQPYLWSNNPILVKVVEQWYESIWEKGAPEALPAQTNVLKSYC